MSLPLLLKSHLIVHVAGREQYVVLLDILFSQSTWREIIQYVCDLHHFVVMFAIAGLSEAFHDVLKAFGLSFTTMEIPYPIISSSLPQLVTFQWLS